MLQNEKPNHDHLPDDAAAYAVLMSTLALLQNTLTQSKTYIKTLHRLYTIFERYLKTIKPKKLNFFKGLLVAEERLELPTRGL